MGSHPAILTIFPGVLTISTEPPSPPSFSWPQLCALGRGPEVCGQGSLALLSSGPVSPSHFQMRHLLYYPIFFSLLFTRTLLYTLGVFMSVI